MAYDSNDVMNDDPDSGQHRADLQSQKTVSRVYIHGKAIGHYLTESPEDYQSNNREGNMDYASPLIT